MKTKNKLLTVLVVFLLLLLLAGFGAFKPKVSKQETDPSKTEQDKVNTIEKKSSLKLGGIESRMPENSAQVFFTSTMGKKISKYTSYKNMDESLLALRSGEVDAIWACDVTAKYLVKTNKDLEILDNSSMADIQKTEDARFSFGMALKDTKESETLREEINTVLAGMRKDGTLQSIVEEYIENAADLDDKGDDEKYYPSKMRSASGKSVIKVGVTGAVSPIELLDKEGTPYGFCVALMDEIGVRLGKKIIFVTMDNETAFTSLMSGRVDMLFTYGTGRKTTESKQNHIMTDGYYDMQRYEFVINK